MEDYPYVDLDLLRTYALRIDYWSRSMVDAMKISVRCYTGTLRCDKNWNANCAFYYIECDRMECTISSNWTRNRPTITWDEFVEMSSPQEDFSEQLAALLGI